MRKKRILLVVASAVAGAALSGSTGASAATAQSVACTVTTLPSTTKTAVAEKVDSSGRYVIGNETREQYYRQLYWLDGNVTEVQFAQGWGRFFGVNSSGVAVGWNIIDGKTYPVAYRDGRVVRLPGGDIGGAAWAVNDKGAIAGSIGKSGEIPTPVVWPSADSDPVPVRKPTGYGTVSFEAIGNDGTLYGNFQGTQLNTAYKWFPDGTPSRFPFTVGPEGSDVVDGSGGWAVGAESADMGYTTYYVRWTPEGKEQVLPLSQVSGVNSQGWAVGRGKDDGAATLVVGDSVVKLPVSSGTEYSDAKDVNDTGTVAGYKPALGALLWRCS